MFYQSEQLATEEQIDIMASKIKGNAEIIEEILEEMTKLEIKLKLNR